MAKETCASRMAGTGSLPTFKRYIVQHRYCAVSAIIFTLSFEINLHKDFFHLFVDGTINTTRNNARVKNTRHPKLCILANYRRDTLASPTSRFCEEVKVL